MENGIERLGRNIPERSNCKCRQKIFNKFPSEENHKPHTNDNSTSVIGYDCGNCMYSVGKFIVLHTHTIEQPNSVTTKDTLRNNARKM